MADAEHLAGFARGIAALPPFTLCRPFDLLPGVRINVATARLFRRGPGKEQAQMTRALPMEKATEPAPAWWPDGMDWSALPEVKKLVSFMKTPGFAGSNPKTAFGSELLKVSVTRLLGTPKRELEQGEIDAFVENMAKLCGVASLLDKDPNELMPIVRATRGNPLHMRLVATKFTWRDYFAGLLVGIDQIARWAKRAFGGTEDIGYATIPDPSLPSGWKISEARNGPEVDEMNAGNYLSYGRRWAKNTRP